MNHINFADVVSTTFPRAKLAEIKLVETPPWETFKAELIAAFTAAVESADETLLQEASHAFYENKYPLELTIDNEFKAQEFAFEWLAHTIAELCDVTVNTGVGIIFGMTKNFPEQTYINDAKQVFVNTVLNSKAGYLRPDDRRILAETLELVYNAAKVILEYMRYGYNQCKSGEKL